MKTRIQKWGNSLAMRIPKHIAQEVGLHEGQEVDVFSEDGKLVAKPSQNVCFELSLLLKKVNRKNIHGETSWSESVGKEIV